MITSPAADDSTPTPIARDELLDGRDAIALLDPQLRRVVDLGDAVGERGRDREHGDLVLHERDLVRPRWWCR